MERDDVAQKWGKSPSEFKALDEDDRVHMAAKIIADGMIETVYGDV